MLGQSQFVGGQGGSVGHARISGIKSRNLIGPLLELETNLNSKYRRLLVMGYPGDENL
jgi:hypothetical protein